MCCSSPRAPSIWPSRRTCCPNCRAACRSASSCKALTRDDLVRILTEPEASLITQYKALLATEEVTLDFTPEAIEAIADLAAEINAASRTSARGGCIR